MKNKIQFTKKNKIDIDEKLDLSHEICDYEEFIKKNVKDLENYKNIMQEIENEDEI